MFIWRRTEKGTSASRVFFSISELVLTGNEVINNGDVFGVKKWFNCWIERLKKQTGDDKQRLKDGTLVLLCTILTASIKYSFPWKKTMYYACLDIWILTFALAQRIQIVGNEIYLSSCETTLRNIWNYWKGSEVLRF